MFREVGVDDAEIARAARGRECSHEVAGSARRGMIWGVGLNYRDHAAETGRPLPEAPTLFVKSPSSVIAPGEPIVRSRRTSRSPTTKASSRS